MAKTHAPPGDVARVAEDAACVLLGVPSKTLRLMVRAGFVPVPVKGAYQMLATVKGAARFLSLGLMTKSDAAEALGYTKSWITELERNGHLKPERELVVSLGEVAKAQIAFLTDEARRSAKSSAASRVTDARTREIELRIADKEATHLQQARDEAIAAADNIIGGLRADLMAAPARITADLEMRRKIEKVVDDALRAAADRSEKLAAGLSADSDAAEAGAEVDA